MSENFTREGKKVNRNHFNTNNNNNNNNTNNKNLKDNNEFSNHCDGIFAQLTDMFGDVITSDVILNVCNKSDWDLTTCIENLIHESSEQSSNITLDESSKNINQIKNNCKITENELLINSNSNNQNSIAVPNNELVETELKATNENVENSDIDVVIESEEQILDIAKRELINDTNNVNLGAIKKQLTQKTTPVENISNSSALKPFNFSSLLKQGDNHLFNLSNTQETVMQQKTTKSKNIPKSPNYEKIIHLIKQGIKIMIIMRGAPGSGKSYLAKKIIDETVKEPYRNHIFSSDTYFYDAQDRYCFNPDKLPDAHSYNQKLVTKKCHEGWSPIIVDNTNIKLWEMYPYIDIAAQYGYFIEILEPQTPWANSPRQLAQRNSHGVASASIERMLDNYEKINIYNLLRIRGLEFHLSISSQLRRYPIINPKVDNTAPTNNDPPVEMEPQTNIPDNPISTEEISVISDKVVQFQMKREWNEDWVDHQSKEMKKTEIEDVANAPKPPRKMKHLNSNNLKEEAIKRVNSNVDDVIEISNQYNLIDWKAHDQEMKDFWSKANVPLPEDKTITLKNDSQPQTPKSQRALQKKTSNVGQNNEILNLLGENNTQGELKLQSSFDGIPSSSNSPLKLEKHKVGCEYENKSFSQIRQIYPTVPIEYLWDLFETCRGDGDWTMDILLKDESKLAEFSTPTKNGNNFKNFDCGCSRQMNVDLISFDDLPSNSIVVDSDSTQSNLHTMPKGATALQSSSSSPNLTNARPTSNRKDKGIISEEMQIAKRQIEEKIMFGDEHYSEHMRKIRDIRRGVPPSSTTIDFKVNSETDQGAALNGLQSDAETQSNDDTESSETDNEELVEVALGIELVSQLDNLFGINAYPKNTLKSMKTNVFMSRGLAKQLYALWMESIYNQIEEQKQKSLKEDEELARQLHSKEKYPKLFKEPTNFKEIMDMEYAWAAYKAEIDEWKVTTPETLASRLSKEKLQHIFPNVEKETLEEVLSAHNNKFEDTVTTLRDSLKFSINEEILAESNDLFEQARLEMEKPDENYPITRSLSSGSSKSLDIKKISPDEAKRLALIDFEDFRNNAMHHDQLKTECYAKAQSAIQRGETSVALYYSQVAKLHKNKMDMYNQKAANCIMEVHSLTQNNPDIVDLHYLRVSEAVECLDIFLDKHINKLKSSPQNSKHLHIITGRGLHSARGIPTVKLKVKNRLKERNLKCIEVNPGLLKVKIFPNAKLSQI